MQRQLTSVYLRDDAWVQLTRPHDWAVYEPRRGHGLAIEIDRPYSWDLNMSNGFRNGSYLMRHLRRKSQSQVVHYFLTFHMPGCTQYNCICFLNANLMTISHLLWTAHLSKQSYLVHRIIAVLTLRPRVMSSMGPGATQTTAD